jgi:phospholipase C
VANQKEGDMALKELLRSTTAKPGHGSVRSAAYVLGIQPPISLRRLMLEGTRELVKREHRVKHVFVLMLENRSFDHIFGFAKLAGVDPLGLPRSADGVPAGLPSSNDWVKPEVTTTASFSATTGAPFKLSGNDGDKDPPHEFNDVLLQLCGQTAFQALPTDEDGNVLLQNGYPPIDNSGFVASYHRTPTDSKSKADTVMRCFDPAQLPVLHALASHFAVCDNWFASMPGPTWPNRFFVHAASSGGMDDSPSQLEIAASETVAGYGFENGTLYDLLDDHDIDWLVFEGDEFPQVFALEGMNLNALAGHFVDFDEFESALKEDVPEVGYVFIEPAYKVFHEYECGTSMHPLDDVTRGERLIKKVYETLRASDLWTSSVLVVLFDEHGGFFDHVAPPEVVSPGDSPSDDDITVHKFAFDRLGPRVPAIVVSPWVVPSVIDHTRYDHASVPSSVEALFGLKHLTRRDAHASDFLHLLSLHAPREDAPIHLPDAAQPGMDCTDEEEAHAGITPQAAAQALTTDPGKGSWMGFLQVAVRRHLSLLPPAQHKLVIDRARSIHTAAEARSYMHDVRKIVRERRVAGRTVAPVV